MNVSVELSAVFGFVIVFTVWLVNLGAKVKELEKNAEKYEQNIDEIEQKILMSIDQLKDTMHLLSIQVTKVMERMEHFNRSVANIKADEIRRSLD